MSSQGYHRLVNDGASSDTFVSDTLQQHDMIIREQDENLERVSGSLGTLKSMSHRIGDELEEQADLLEDLESAMHRTDTKMDNIVKKLTKLTNMDDDRRFGNQFEQLLGVLALSKSINRTLVLPPFLEYPLGSVKAIAVPFTKKFAIEPIQQFHRAISMENFMYNFSAEIWPKENRIALCSTPRLARENNDEIGCHPKTGNPFQPFWDHYGIDFVGNMYYGDIGYDLNDKNRDKWEEMFPTSKYPVLSFTSAPSPMPMRSSNRWLQSYFKFSKDLADAGQKFIHNNLKRPFIGIHLRNNGDWKSACSHVDGNGHFFASAQCTGDKFENGRPTKQLCYPSKEQILSDIKRAVSEVNPESVFVSSDKDFMISELKHTLSDKIGLRRLPEPENDLYLSLYVLSHSDHFIGNCMSTFTSFVVRQRNFSSDSVKPFSFFGINDIENERFPKKAEL